MKSLRSAVGLAQLVVLVSGLLMPCPCPVKTLAGEEHGCCASEGIRAATSCCATTPAPQAPEAAQLAAAAFVPMLTDSPSPLSSASAAAVLVARTAPLAAPPPLVLRI